MSWLKIDNPDIDGQKIQAEIEAEVDRFKKEGELTPGKPELEKAFSAFTTPRPDSGRLDTAEAYARGWDTETLARRRPGLSPLLALLVKILKRVLKPQYIFNSLILEVLRNQEKRIKDLEKRRPRSD